MSCLHANLRGIVSYRTRLCHTEVDDLEKALIHLGYLKIDAQATVFRVAMTRGAVPYALSSCAPPATCVAQTGLGSAPTWRHACCRGNIQESP